MMILTPENASHLSRPRPSRKNNDFRTFNHPRIRNVTYASEFAKWVSIPMNPTRTQYQAISPPWSFFQDPAK
jgi:hypothetical protein